MNIHPIYHRSRKSGKDAELWSRLKNGDKNALGLIYTEHFDKLYNYGSRMLPDLTQLEDCIQDLFIEIWNGRINLGDVSFIKLYLFTCLRRKIWHVQSRPWNKSEPASFPLELSHNSHFLNQQIDAELQQQLVQILNCLTPQQKEAIFLIYYDEFSYKEAADLMHLKVRTIYNLVHEGILRLRQHKRHLSSFFSLLFF